MRKLTEMNKARFVELLDGIDDGSLLEKWADDKKPETKTEKVEARQIRALGMLKMEDHSLTDLRNMDFDHMEFWTDGKLVHLRVYKVHRELML